METAVVAYGKLIPTANSETPKAPRITQDSGGTFI